MVNVLEEKRSFQMFDQKPVDNNSTWNRIQGNWTQFTGLVHRQWGKLTNDDLAQINGNRELLAGKIQNRYGIAQSEAQRQVDEWTRSLNL